MDRHEGNAIDACSPPFWWWVSHDLGRLLRRQKTTLDFLDGRVTAAKYVTTLQSHLQPAFDAETHIVQHDNAAPHAASYTKTWLKDQGFDVIKWPACSPDLNPIKKLWGYVTHHVYANGHQFYSIEALKNAIQQVWDKIPVSYLLALVTSIPTQVQMIKDANGKHIPY